MNPSDTQAQTPLASGDDQNSSLPPIAPIDPATTATPITAQTPPVTPPVGMSAPDPATQAAATKFSQHAPDVAEDVDLIEKEWVTKAKTIVDSTRGNPNEQSKEMSRFKADYLRTRYSRDIKVSD